MPGWPESPRTTNLIPDFQALLHSCDNDLQRFYSRVRELGELSQPERLARLKELFAAGGGGTSGKLKNRQVVQHSLSLISTLDRRRDAFRKDQADS